ncbi:HD domain-containing protein [Nonomuraea sp. NEAU-A123]|uniref:HD domain-containing protein n=1 Tax=Nonomuraea sp. NEAU-A123 TaxID=2839649 RepID=UPI001BE3F45A|nr:HD domain-containing protein [Nonomuraea sp. NEAU-A123]MBT2233237.1 HD domain-containing protein [Nonomuraea sp. NEAU-A123]
MSTLEKAIPDYLTADQARMVERAYTVAAYWHRHQTRRSGEPYITHPLAVAAILADLGADHELLCAALLHDLLEDTACPETELVAEFGETIVRLVTDLRQLEDPARPAEDWRDTTDERVLTLKLADRLHNQRTMRFLPPEKQLRKARETLDVFVPIAGRLGMDEIGRELEGLAQARLGVSGDAGMQAILRVITAGATILPHAVRARWIAEWLGELHALPDQRARRRFTVELLVGMPRLAVMLRRRNPDRKRRLRW